MQRHQSIREQWSLDLKPRWSDVIATIPNGAGRRSLAILVPALLCLSGGCGIFQPPLPTVSSVDLERYAGKWFELARYPNFFERNCVGVTAEYTLRDDGRVTVLNTCREGSLDGDIRDIEGVARSVDPSNAKLKVSFFGPFEGDYWIIDLDEDYQVAMVSEPGRRFFWILSRTPTLESDTYDELIAKAVTLGINPDRIERVEQETGSSDGGG